MFTFKEHNQIKQTLQALKKANIGDLNKQAEQYKEPKIFNAIKGDRDGLIEYLMSKQFGDNWHQLER